MRDPVQSDAPTELTTTEARQGNGRRMNLRILVISTVLTALALGAIFFVFAR